MWHRLLLGAGMVVKEGPLPVSMGLTDMGDLGQKWLSLPSGTLREAGERLNVILQSKEFGEQGREF